MIGHYYITFVLLISCYVVSAMDKGYELLKAAEHGNLEKLKELLNEGVPMYTRNNYGVSPITWAANNGHTETLQELLDRGGYIEDRSNNGRTPLSWAARWGHVNTTILLIERGANMSAVDIDGMTPLMHAVSNNHTLVVKELIDRGAPITTKNFHGGTALSIAKIKGFVDIVDMIEHHFEIEYEHSVYYLLLHHFYLYFKKMTIRGINRANYHLGFRSSNFMETEL